MEPLWQQRCGWTSEAVRSQSSKDAVVEMLDDDAEVGRQLTDDEGRREIERYESQDDDVEMVDDGEN